MRRSFAKLSCSDDTKKEEPSEVPHSGQPSQPPSEQHIDYESDEAVEEESVEEALEIEEFVDSEEESLEEDYSDLNSPSHFFDESDYQQFQVQMSNNAISVTDAYFIDYGDAHHIVISFHDWTKSFMSLTIDNETIYEVDTSSQSVGNTLLDIEDLVVYFEWDLDVKPMKFSFRTRGLLLGGGGNDENNWGDYEVLNLIEIEVTED
ncbi:hypothetical protein MA16_Dca027805 [Dendrobium catenatum]|uniref:Uncharacterized protein n=1 Tax=Dendrobium catenatum TaxID=906689 RepID=A0A2I0WP67_9ASPA|nr:hypothetical protein MA16_Dca027805 [Dendrobium catenatum]